MCRVEKNMMLTPEYYKMLNNLLTDSFKEFLAIIDLDVRRTPAAIRDQTIYRKLTNILMAYSKYHACAYFPDEILESDTAKDSMD